MNGTVVQCEKSLKTRSGLSELLAQFSGAVRGLSAERHCTLAMQPPRKLSHAWRSERERWLRV